MNIRDQILLVAGLREGLFLRAEAAGRDGRQVMREELEKQASGLAHVLETLKAVECDRKMEAAAHE